MAAGNTPHSAYDAPPPPNPGLSLLENMRPLGGRRGCCRVVAWLQETRVIAVGGDDGIIRLYTEAGRECTPIHTHHDRVFGICEGGRDTVISIGLDGWIRAWDLGRHSVEIHSIMAPDKKACTAVYVLHSTHVIVGTEHGSLAQYHWNGRRFNLLCHSIRAHKNQIEDIHAIDEVIAVAGRDQSVSLWDPEKLFRIKDLHFSYRVYSVRINQRFIAVGAKGLIRLYNNNRPDFIIHVEIPVSCACLRRMLFIRDDLFLAVGEIELAIVGVNGYPRILHRCETPAKYVQDAALLPTGEVAVVGVGKDANSFLRLPYEMSALIQISMQHFTNPNKFEPRRRSKNTRFRMSNRSGYNSANSNPRDACSRRDANDKQFRNPEESDTRFQRSRRQESNPTTEMISFMNSENYYAEESSLSDTNCESVDTDSKPSSLGQKSFARIQLEGLAGYFEPHFLATTSQTEFQQLDEPKKEHLEKEESISDAMKTMSKWTDMNLTSEQVRSLDIDAFSQLMVASMVKNPRWADMVEKLIGCIQSFLRSNNLTASDVVGNCTIETETITKAIGQAMENHEGIGARSGVLNRAKNFINKYRV